MYIGKSIQGYQYFQCETCNGEWRERVRDCTSFSDSVCPRCHNLAMMIENEPHPEWPIDIYGDLIKSKIEE